MQRQPIPRPNLSVHIMNQQQHMSGNIQQNHNFNGSMSTSNHVPMTLSNAPNINLQNHPNYNISSAHRNEMHLQQQNNVLSRQNSTQARGHSNIVPNQQTDIHSHQNININGTNVSHNMTSQHIQRLNNVSVNSQFSPPSVTSEPPRLFHPPSNQVPSAGGAGGNYYQSSQQLKHLAEKQWTTNGQPPQMNTMQPDMANQYNRSKNV